MDRYEQIIRDVQQKTRDEHLKWVVVQPSAYARVLLNPDRVIRAFIANYALSDKTFTLLFVEKKVDHFDEFGETQEEIVLELFVLDHVGDMILSLYDGVVDRDDLSKLAGLIDEHNDKAQEFFAAFEKSGAA